MTDSLHSSRYTTQIKNEKNTLMPLQSRSHIGIYLFSFRFYEYVFHCFPHIYTKKNKTFPCHVSFYLYISPMLYVFLLLGFWLFHKKKSCLRVSCYMVQNRIYLMVFHFFGLSTCHIYVFYRRKENFLLN